MSLPRDLIFFGSSFWYLQREQQRCIISCLASVKPCNNDAILCVADARPHLNKRNNLSLTPLSGAGDAAKAGVVVDRSLTDIESNKSLATKAGFNRHPWFHTFSHDTLLRIEAPPGKGGGGVDRMLQACYPLGIMTSNSNLRYLSKHHSVIHLLPAEIPP